MRPLTPHLIDFLDARRVGVLATVDKAATPRQSVVYYVRERPYPSAVFSGPAEILTEGIGPAGGHRPRDSGDHRRGRDGRQLPAGRERGSSFVNRDSDRRR